MIRRCTLNVTIPLVLTILSGCSARDWHQHVQSDRRAACRSEPTPDLRQQCLAEAERSFEAWQRDLQTLDDAADGSQDEHEPVLAPDSR